MPLKDLLRVADLSPSDLTLLLDLSSELKTNPGVHGKPLDGETVVLYFAKPSTRTRISFEAAIEHFGGLPTVVGPAELQLGRGETIEDTARVISEYARAFVIRTFLDEDVRRFAAAATIPVINALTNGHHPCQGIADIYTLREHFGCLSGLRLAYVGNGNNNVTNSLLEGAALAGVDVAVATPPGYEPDADVVRRAVGLAQESRAHVLLTHDPVEAVDAANAVYTDVWLSMGDPDEQRAERIAALAPFQVTRQLMGHAAADAVFMHCLPAHRGEEVEPEVIDGPRSIVFTQAENRLSTEAAILFALVDGKLTGAPRLVGTVVGWTG